MKKIFIIIVLLSMQLLLNSMLNAAEHKVHIDRSHTRVAMPASQTFPIVKPLNIIDIAQPAHIKTEATPDEQKERSEKFDITFKRMLEGLNSLKSAFNEKNISHLLSDYLQCLETLANTEHNETINQRKRNLAAIKNEVFEYFFAFILGNFKCIREKIESLSLERISDFFSPQEESAEKKPQWTSLKAYIRILAILMGKNDRIAHIAMLDADQHQKIKDVQSWLEALLQSFEQLFIRLEQKIFKDALRSQEVLEKWAQITHRIFGQYQKLFNAIEIIEAIITPKAHEFISNIAKIKDRIIAAIGIELQIQSVVLGINEYLDNYEMPPNLSEQFEKLMALKESLERINPQAIKHHDAIILAIRLRIESVNRLDKGSIDQIKHLKERIEKLFHAINMPDGIGDLTSMVSELAKAIDYFSLFDETKASRYAQQLKEIEAQRAQKALIEDFTIKLENLANLLNRTAENNATTIIDLKFQIKEHLSIVIAAFNNDQLPSTLKDQYRELVFRARYKLKELSEKRHNEPEPEQTALAMRKIAQLSASIDAYLARLKKGINDDDDDGYAYYDACRKLCQTIPAIIDAYEKLDNSAANMQQLWIAQQTSNWQKIVHLINPNASIKLSDHVHKLINSALPYLSIGKFDPLEILLQKLKIAKYISCPVQREKFLNLLYETAQGTLIAQINILFRDINDGRDIEIMIQTLSTDAKYYLEFMAYFKKDKEATEYIFNVCQKVIEKLLKLFRYNSLQPEFIAWNHAINRLKTINNDINTLCNQYHLNLFDYYVNELQNQLSFIKSEFNQLVKQQNSLSELNLRVEKIIELIRILSFFPKAILKHMINNNIKNYIKENVTIILKYMNQTFIKSRNAFNEIPLQEHAKRAQTFATMYSLIKLINQLNRAIDNSWLKQDEKVAYFDEKFFQETTQQLQEQATKNASATLPGMVAKSSKS